ncbi:MAG: carbonic anhydrase [Patescibacteria group bacterium]|jgi:carbonic anhydrase
MSNHTCDAFVVACIDFRFQKYLKQWLDENMNQVNKTYDFVGFAGSTKSLETIMGQLDISVRLHQVKEVVLVHHEECGAYGSESTHDRHAEDLNKAKKTILEKYPNLKVDLFYLHLNGEFEKIQ